MRVSSLLALILVLEPATVSVASARTKPIPPEEFRHVLLGQIVLSARPDPSWGTGPISLDLGPEERLDPVWLHQSVDERRLPANLLRWRGQAVEWIASDGIRCASTVSGFSLVGMKRWTESHPWWTELEEHNAGKNTPRFNKAWKRGAHYLVAHTSMPPGRCYEAGWARAAATAPPLTATIAEVGGRPQEHQLSDMVRAAFRALPAYREIQRRFRARPSLLPPRAAWWDAAYGSGGGVLAFRTPGRTLLYLKATGPHGGQYGFDRLFAIWELRGTAAQPQLVLRQLAAGKRVPLGMVPKAAFRREDDEIDLLYTANEEHGLMRLTGVTMFNDPALRIECAAR